MPRSLLFVVAAIGALLPAAPSVRAQIREFPIASERLGGFEPGEGLAGLAQTSDGFLWTATHRAVLRFDGVETRRFVPDTPELEGVSWRPRWIASSSDDALWLPSSSGLVEFDPQRERFTLHVPEEESPSQDLLRVSASLEDDAGRVWACTMAGIALVDREARTYALQPPLDPEPLRDLESDPIERILPDWAQRAVCGPEGHLWIGTHFGLCRLDPETGASRRVLLVEPARRVVVTGLCFASDGRLWVGTGEGLFRFDPRSGRAERLPNTEHLDVLDVTVDGSDRVLLSTSPMVIEIRSSDGELIGHALPPNVASAPRSPLEPGFRYTDARRPVRSPAFRSLLVDRDRRLWAVGPDGLWSGDTDTGFESYRVPGIEEAQDRRGLSAWSDADGTLWFGGNTTGLHRISADGLSAESAYVDPNFGTANIWDCLRDARGNLWFADNNDLKFFRPDGVLESAALDGDPSLVRALHEDPLGALIAVTSSGPDDRVYVAGDDLRRWTPAEPVPWTSSAAGRSGTWLGGELAIFHWEPATRTVRELSPDLLPPDCRVRDPKLCGDGEGGFWMIGTRWIHRFDPQSAGFRRVDALDRAFDNGGRPTSITRGPGGRVWLFTARSVVAYDPDGGAWRSFGAAHGLPDVSFYSSKLTPSGAIVAATDGGVVRFRPETVMRPASPPRPRLIAVRVADRPVEPGDGLDLTYRDDLVSFRLAVALERDPGRLEYSFLLEGLDEEWRSNGSRRDLTFANLPSGDYALRVRARRGGEDWSPDLRVASLRISPAFWETLWFRSLLVLTGVLLVAGIYRARTRSMRERAASLQLKNELQSRLEDSRRLESLGRLAGGVSHDFNNITTALLGHSDLLELAVDDIGDDATSAVYEIRRASERAAELTSQLLAFSRQQIQRPRVFDPGPVVRDLVPMLRRLTPSDIELEVDAPDGVGPICADQGQLEQVIVNFVANARDAMETGGRIAIRIDRVNEIPADVEEREAASSGPHVVLTVEDDGAGIPEDVLPHVFEPFYTTKPVGRGTGLGLASVHGIVHQSGGIVTVRSRAGHGTEFRVFFPVSREKATPARPDEASEGIEPMLSGLTVVVCEDDEAILAILARRLEQRDAQVLAARSPREALALVEARGEGPVHALVTDLVMPGMRGGELASVLRARWPEAHVLFVSGYSDGDLPDLPGSGRVDFLSKPFSGRQVVDRLNRLLADVES